MRLAAQNAIEAAFRGRRYLCRLWSLPPRTGHSTGCRAYVAGVSPTPFSTCRFPWTCALDISHMPRAADDRRLPPAQPAPSTGWVHQIGGITAMPEATGMPQLVREDV